MRYLLPAGPAFGPLAGLFILGANMAIEPPVKRTLAFFDGQNLFHHAKAAFGHTYPNFDPKKLTESICTSRGWVISGIHFYTGVPFGGSGVFTMATKTEHAGAKNSGGYWGKRAQAKQRCKQLRRKEDRKSVLRGATENCLKENESVGK